MKIRISQTPKSISYPDIYLEIDDKNLLRSKLYDKRDDTFDILKLFLLAIFGPSWSWSHGSWVYNYLCNLGILHIRFNTNQLDALGITLKKCASMYMMDLSMDHASASLCDYIRTGLAQII